MAHQDHIVDRLSPRIGSLLPDHIKEEAPIFEAFLESYFEYLESEIITLDTVQELDGVQFEEGTQIATGAFLLEEGTDATAPDIADAKLLQEDSTNPFVEGEYIYGSTSGSVAKIKVINNKVLIVDTISGSGFAIGETITGRDGNRTGTIKTYKENQIVANNRLLDYGDIDQTLETFLNYFQKDFIPSLDLKDTQNKRLTLKNIGSLYKQKGTADSVKFLMRILYGQNAEVKYPIDETIFASESSYAEDRRMNIVMSSGVPKDTDKIIQYNEANPDQIDAEAVIDQVEPLSVINKQYSVSISDTHRGTFQPNRVVSIVDRDGIITYTATVKGIVSDIITTEASTTFGLENEDGDLCLEDGTVGTSTVDGALLFEGSNIGSMYDLNDEIIFTGAKTDTDVVNARATVAGITRGPVEEIYVENGGSGYSAGDIVVFEDGGTEGGGAEGIIAATGDEIILENDTAFDQYEYTAVAGQTTFGGVDSSGNTVRDINGKPTALNGLDIKVFIDGVEQSESIYETKLDRVTFIAPLDGSNNVISPTPSGGEKVEIVSRFSRLVQEDGDPFMLESSDQRIRRVHVTNGGAGYEKIPRVFPGGFLYFDDVTGYTVGELVTGQTSNATGEITRIDTKNKRLVIRRATTHVNTFIANELVLGGSSGTSKTCTLAKVTSGTGGNLFAWSSKIGGVEKLRLTNQGYNFDENAVIGDDSFYNMLIGEPSAATDLSKDTVLTGSTSGATAKVVSFDNQRNLLKFTDRNGTFLEDEKVTYAVGQSFKILKFDPYDARGKFAGEGIINDNFFGEKGYLSNETSNIQDGKLYQTHSYIIKVGESIDKYRSIVKDLVHPSGHIFFGEVAVESVIVQDDRDGRFSVDPDNTLGVQSTTFIPTLVMVLEQTEHILLEDATRDSQNKVLLEESLYQTYNAGTENEITRLIQPVYIEDEAAFEPSFVSERQVTLLFHTTKSELDALAMQIVLDQFNQVTTGLDSTKAFGNETGRTRVESIKKFIDSPTTTKLGNEITQPIAPTLVTHETLLQKSPRLDGAITVLNLSNTPTHGQDGYLTLDDENASSPVGVRPQDQGKVFSYASHIDERLMFEDGAYIQSEEPLNHLMHEPTGRDLGGDLIQFEDATTVEDPPSSGTQVSVAGGRFLLEDDTVPEQIEYFLTERSTELFNPYFYTEANDRLVMEDGGALVHEGLGTGQRLHSFAPIGPSFKTLNKIAFQDTYLISYYLLDESRGSGDAADPDFDNTDEDRIILESGTEGGSGHILLEESKREGLRVDQMNELLGNFYISSFPTHENRKTNIAFSTYVSSTNIKGTTIDSL